MQQSMSLKHEPSSEPLETETELTPVWEIQVGFTRLGSPV